MDTTRNVEEFFKNVQAECKKMNNYTTDWQQIRIQAAIAAMQGILSNEVRHEEALDSSDEELTPWARVAIDAVDYAYALVKELKGE